MTEQDFFKHALTNKFPHPNPTPGVDSSEELYVLMDRYGYISFKDLKLDLLNDAGCFFKVPVHKPFYMYIQAGGIYEEKLFDRGLLISPKHFPQQYQPRIKEMIEDRLNLLRQVAYQ